MKGTEIRQRFCRFKHSPGRNPRRVKHSWKCARHRSIRPTSMRSKENTRRGEIQIAHELGFKTVNVVRRAELIDELRAEGGDVILMDGEKLRDEVKAATSGAPIRLGLNAVGGESALHLANCLAFGGTLVSFGAMSMQPLKIPTGLLIFNDLLFRGIWINHWYDHATMQERTKTFQELFEMAKRGLLKTKVEKAYSIDEAKAAVAHASQSKRSGKIICEFKA